MYLTQVRCYSQYVPKSGYRHSYKKSPAPRFVMHSLHIINRTTRYTPSCKLCIRMCPSQLLANNHTHFRTGRIRRRKQEAALQMDVFFLFFFCFFMFLVVCGLLLLLLPLLLLLLLASAGLPARLAVSIFQLVGQPIKPFVETVAAGRAGCLNIPVAVS